MLIFSIIESRKRNKLVARKYLNKKKYKIIAKEFVTSLGVIDYIVYDENEDLLTFIVIETLTPSNYELKFRKKEITKKYINDKNIIDNIMWYVNKHAVKCKLQLDILQIYSSGKKAKVKHRKNIYDLNNLNNFDLLRDVI